MNLMNQRLSNMRNRLSYSLGIIFLGLIHLGFSAPVDSVRLEQVDGKDFVIHQVDQGETLYGLSRRYSASVEQISTVNNLVNYGISVGQELRIPYKKVQISGIFHTVDGGETLYSISKAYNVTVAELTEWNNLQDNSISIGQKLSISPDTKLVISDSDIEETSIPTVEEVDKTDDNSAKETSVQEKVVVENPTPVTEYLVQASESMRSIAAKFGVSEDSIRTWNNLRSNRLKIGQKLVFPFEVNMDSLALSEEKPGFKDTQYGSKYSSSEDGGVRKLYEEGVAKVIDSNINSTKYLALHRSLSVGTVFQVKNLMNNKTIYVRVVGKLPDTGINDQVMIRLTPKAFDRLGIIDEKALVGITYFDE
jgi:LysM repeat protein